MAQIDIHGFKVDVDQESSSLKYAVSYLNKLSKDEAEVFFDAARRDRTNGTCHFETPHSSEHTNVSHNLTLIYKSDGTYKLRKRSGH